MEKICYDPRNGHTGLSGCHPRYGVAPFENHPASIDFSQEELRNKRL
ncbi:hypothetical protein ACMX9J_10430 [Priestia sp. RMT2NF4]